MTIRRKWAIAGLVLAMAVLATACSDVSNDDNSRDSGATGATTGATGGVPDNSDVTIKLAVNAWVGAEANANVAANLLRDQLGYTVELVEDRRVRAVPGAGVRRPGRDARGVAVRAPEGLQELHPGRRRRRGRGRARRDRADRLVPPDVPGRREPRPRDVGGLEGQRGHVRDLGDRIIGPAGGRRPGVRLVRPADRRQPGSGLQGDLRGLGGRGARRRSTPRTRSRIPS